MERLDYFLIWSSGIKHKYEIFNIIRSEFEILSIHRRSVPDISKFVKSLYSCDTVPFGHLVAKTRYLIKLDPEIVFILLRNLLPDEQIVGTGAFKHKQCMKINRVKSKIRIQFNPEKDDHVVHASDYESQTYHAMKLLKINRPEKGVAGAWRVAKLADLKANVLDVGLVSIEETPHYSYVKGQKGAYRDYYEANYGRRLTDDHAPEAFDLLIGNFSYDKPIRVSGNRIIDGVHRAAILQSKGIKDARVEDINI